MNSESPIPLELLPQSIDLWQSTLDWCPDSDRQNKFQQLYSQTIAANRQFNLTRITQVDEFWEKHLWDSIRGIKDLILSTEKISLVDIGTGAGFPGLPIAIIKPDWQVDLVDSTTKKINFVRSTSAELKLTNTNGITDRIESLGRNRFNRETYQLATIRAVASASVCAEYALPLVKVGGSVILYRGNWTEEESASLAVAVSQLGGEIAKVDRFTTPLTDSLRHCIWLSKITRTPAEFPRDIGIPSQSPLGS
jgi:16S rRNA (guanine527-N7)-methyltransferase